MQATLLLSGRRSSPIAGLQSKEIKTTEGTLGAYIIVSSPSISWYFKQQH
jgi:hypothetical protein